jgi:predicted hydrolase (HD superfamily)
MKPANRDEALQLLNDVGAPARLYRHAELVGEAADLLIAGLRKLRFEINEDYVKVGVALHDVGKSIHHHELTGPGHQHEPDGEKLLLSKGVSPVVARVCRSHAQWRTEAETTEELLIALSDKLWKGVRVSELEELVIDRLSSGDDTSRWDYFTDLDTLFEEVASSSEDRLSRSIV